MTTKAKIGHSTTFARSDDGTAAGNLVELAEVKTINGVNVSRETADATHMKSPNRYREKISSMRDGGQASVGLNWIAKDADYTNALADLNSDDAGYYVITFPDGSTWAFSGFLIEAPLDTPIDAAMTVEFNYDVTGQPVFTAGA